MRYESTTTTDLFSAMLKGYNANPNGYKNLSASQCAKRYNTEFMSGSRNLFLLTNHISNATYNYTVLRLIDVSAEQMASRWLCRSSPQNRRQNYQYMCDTSELIADLERGLPWQMDLGQVGVVEISGCMSEVTSERCTVRFSLGIMIVVIGCNLVKACCMVMAVVRSREPTLVTLGDAVDSFLKTPDQTTIGICFADRRYIGRDWRPQRRARPRQWKQKEVQRWWTSVSKKRWIICNCFCSITIIFAGMLLREGMVNDGATYGSADLKSM